MKQRKGHTYRVLDGERFTLAIGGNYICTGSHRRPMVDVIDRRHPNDSIRGYAPKRLASIPLPLVRFRRCFKLRRIGGLVVYRLYSRAMRAICKAPKVAA